MVFGKNMPTDWWSNNLATVSQWSEKNNPVEPWQVSKGSDRKVWWRCPQGHEWETTVLSRLDGHGCPYCSGRRATEETCLATKRPDLVVEWDFSKNRETPQNITWRSPKAVYWVCSLGHKWKAPVANRTNGGTGCPYCAGKKATPENCLLEKFPLVAKEWSPKNPISPDKVLPFTHKKYLWVCPKGHEYKTSVASRTGLQTGCPICAWQTSKLEIRVSCELKTLFPGALWRDRTFGFEVDVLLPDHKIGIEIDGWYWHKGKQKTDLEKNQKLVALGFVPIRLRGQPLPLLGKYDFGFKKSPDQRIVLAKLVGVLSRVLNQTIYYDPNNWNNDVEYQKFVLDH